MTVWPPQLSPPSAPLHPPCRSRRLATRGRSGRPRCSAAGMGLCRPGKQLWNLRGRSERRTAVRGWRSIHGPTASRTQQQDGGSRTCPTRARVEQGNGSSREPLGAPHPVFRHKYYMSEAQYLKPSPHLVYMQQQQPTFDLLGPEAETPAQKEQNSTEPRAPGAGMQPQRIHQDKPPGGHRLPRPDPHNSTHRASTG